jgi:hypothetical protein
MGRRGPPSGMPPVDVNKNTEWFLYPGVWTTYILLLFFAWLLVLSVSGCSPGAAWTVVNLAHFAVSSPSLPLRSQPPRFGQFSNCASLPFCPRMGCARTISSRFAHLFRFVVKSVALTHRLSRFDSTCSFSSLLINPCVIDMLNLEQLFLAAQARAAGLRHSGGSSM